MNVTDYLRANAASLEEPFHPRRSPGFHGLYVDKVDLAFFALIRKTACAHSWLQASVRRTLPSGDARQEVLRWSSEHAEACVASVAHELRESDPFLLQPDGLAFGPFGPDDPEGWLALGLSALILEIILAKAGKIGKEQFAQFHWPLQAMGAGFGNERRFALAEAGRRSSGKRDKRVKEAIAAFIPPCEAAWGAPLIDEAVAALEGRIKSRRALLHDAVEALREAAGLPHDPWPYIEPHVTRHAEKFGIGMGTRLAIRAALKLT
jgi:hypothetical protein